jgi:hypothetical protein
MPEATRDPVDAGGLVGSAGGHPAPRTRSDARREFFNGLLLVDAWEVAPGLWHWAAAHPAWTPGAEPGSPGDWPQLVGSVIAEVGGEPVIVDPMLEADGWAWLDEHVAGRPVHVLTTIRFHGRSRAEVLERYGGDEARPAGVRAIELPDGETLYVFDDYDALVVGDSIIGDGDGGLRRCPPSWLYGRVTDAAQRDAMQPLLELGIERVLVSHGESLFSRAGPALVAAVAAVAAPPEG